MWIRSVVVVAVIVNIFTVTNAQSSTDIPSFKEDDNIVMHGSPTTHSEIGQTTSNSTDYDSNSEPPSTSGYNISGTGIDTTLQDYDDTVTYATVTDNNPIDIQETETVTDEEAEEGDNADTNDSGLPTTTIPAISISTDIPSIQDDDNTVIHGSPTTHSEIGQTTSSSTDYDSNSEPPSTSGYNISGTGIDTTLQHYDNTVTYATVTDNNPIDIQETETVTDEEADESDNADTNDSGLTTTTTPAISTTQDGNFDLQATVIDTAGTSTQDTGNSDLGDINTDSDDSGNSVTNEVNVDESDSTVSDESSENNDSSTTQNALEIPTNDPATEINENMVTTESELTTVDNNNYAVTTSKSNTSGDYIPLATNYPNSDQSDENGITVTGINTDNGNSTGFTAIANNATTGQISSEQPAENGNNLVTSSPSVGNNPSTSDYGSYDVTDANGQAFAEPNGKPITSASAWIYGFLVTIANGSVFTGTEFIGGQPTTSSDKETTTLSNDSSDSATDTAETNTAGLITDGAVEFPTTGSFGNGVNTNLSTITEISVIANNSENTEAPEGSEENEATVSTVSSAIDSYDNTDTSNANSDGSTQLPNGNWSTASSFTQSSVDIFNNSADKQSEMNPIIRGTCGLPKGGPMIQQALPAITSLSRGLAWSTENEALYFADVFKPAVSQYTPRNGRVVTLNLDGTLVNAIIPTSRKHQFIVALDHRLLLLQNSFTKDENITDHEKVLVQFNAIHSLGVAKTDLQGRLWIPVRVKTSNDGIIDKLYVINGGKAEYKDTFRKNYGMAWSADNKYFYVADSEPRTGYIYVYDFERKAGSIKNRKILFNKNNHPELTGYISDIAVDRNGNIWASINKNSLIIKIDHVSGNMLEMIALPTHYPISLAFGNGRQDKLFVGTAYHSTRAMDAPYTYVISKLGVTGISATKEVQLKKIFGSTTINVYASSADDQAPPSDAIPTDSSRNETCEINKDLLEIKDRNTGACTIVKDKPIVQEAIAPVETTAAGLHWDFRTNAMYLADAYVPALIKYTPYNGKTITLKFENATTVTAIIPIRNKPHNYIISAGHSLVQFENQFGENTVQELDGPVIATVKDRDANLIFSRGRTDSQGRLWIGTRFKQPTRRKCSLYMLRRGKLISKISRVTQSGGMTWSLDKKIFYFADAGLGKIYSYDYNARTGSIRNRKIFFDIKSEPNRNGTVSDILVDSKDNLWASVYGGSAVICINSQTAAVTQTISLPMKYPVSLEFGGVKRDTLYVSGARRDTCKFEGMSYTYAISNMGVTGISANYYYTL